MRELIPLKVCIGLTTKGTAKYPSFNDLSVVNASGMDWSRWVDVFGDGWHYDKKCGHRDEGVTPYGEQCGVLLVSKTFADQAVAAFPSECELLDETAFATFYDDRAHAHEPDEQIDEKVLASIKAKQDIGADLTLGQLDALDPAKDEPGIKTNKRKKWADYKVLKGIAIK